LHCGTCTLKHLCRICTGSQLHISCKYTYTYTSKHRACEGPQAIFNDKLPYEVTHLWATVCKTVLSMLSVCLSCLSVTVYSGQTVGWIKMPLATQVGLVPGDIVLDGDPAAPIPPKKEHRPPLFGSCLLWPNGWMDHDTTWYAGRPQPRRQLRWGPSSLTERGTAAPKDGLGFTDTHKARGPCLLWRNGRPSQLLLSTCYTTDHKAWDRKPYPEEGHKLTKHDTVIIIIITV